ncbi:hypothetical protein LTS18_003958 [Coniosporium uncinatum]|uniref:Uncharacterized protein n=1 Tax=Coniosporium uncinatum TaxID=93489 RepID=A0ACC3DBP4_9PEZI|nr:hypothetical protein LTS18_003958 [Coniosporium uncinatum]
MAFFWNIIVYCITLLQLKLEAIAAGLINFLQPNQAFLTTGYEASTASQTCTEQKQSECHTRSEAENHSGPNSELHLPSAEGALDIELGHTYNPTPPSYKYVGSPVPNAVWPGNTTPQTHMMSGAIQEDGQLWLNRGYATQELVTVGHTDEDISRLSDLLSALSLSCEQVEALPLHTPPTGCFKSPLEATFTKMPFMLDDSDSDSEGEPQMQSQTRQTPQAIDGAARPQFGSSLQLRVSKPAEPKRKRSHRQLKQRLRRRRIMRRMIDDPYDSEYCSQPLDSEAEPEDMDCESTPTVQLDDTMDLAVPSIVMSDVWDAEDFQGDTHRYVDGSAPHLPAVPSPVHASSLGVNNIGVSPAPYSKLGGSAAASDDSWVARCALPAPSILLKPQEWKQLIASGAWVEYLTPTGQCNVGLVQRVHGILQQWPPMGVGAIIRLCREQEQVQELIDWRQQVDAKQWVQYLSEIARSEARFVEFVRFKLLLIRPLDAAEISYYCQLMEQGHRTQIAATLGMRATTPVTPTPSRPPQAGSSEGTPGTAGKGPADDDDDLNMTPDELATMNAIGETITAVGEELVKRAKEYFRRSKQTDHLLTRYVITLVQAQATGTGFDPATCDIDSPVAQLEHQYASIRDQVLQRITTNRLKKRGLCGWILNHLVDNQHYLINKTGEGLDEWVETKCQQYFSKEDSMSTERRIRNHLAIKYNGDNVWESLPMVNWVIHQMTAEDSPSQSSSDEWCERKAAAYLADFGGKDIYE